MHNILTCGWSVFNVIFLFLPKTHIFAQNAARVCVFCVISAFSGTNSALIAQNSVKPCYIRKKFRLFSIKNMKIAVFR